MALTDEGFRVVTAAGGEEALAKAEEVRPDIVLLDIVMPDLDGIEVMRQIRERRSVPVILLTGKGSASDKAKGLDLGADDYIAKPFHLDELTARVRAVLRRASGVSTSAGIGPVHFDDVEIDLERRMVTRDGEIVELSRTEWLLLQHLAVNAGKVVLHTELLTKVWGPEYRDDLQYLRVWISRVRRKLGAKPGEPGRIKTFQGIGYLLDVEPGHAESGHGHGHDGAHDGTHDSNFNDMHGQMPVPTDEYPDQVRHDAGRQNKRTKA
jgi:two-component system KDP operon response regulator KdpE